MGELRVRNVGDDTVAILRDRAAREGRSLSNLVNEILTKAAMRPRHECAERLHKLHEHMISQFGELPDSTSEIRAERDRQS